jgi:prepilin-type processing-associated H-X9-DG protein
MKPIRLFLFIGLFAIGSSFMQLRMAAAAEGTAEYAMIQWDGNGNKTQIVWSDGHVEHLDQLLPAVVVPDRTNDRAYIMTLLINKVAKEGYEYVGMASGEELVMRRVK